MVRVEVEACDVCADPAREIEHCMIAIEGEEMVVVLCEEHSEPLHALWRALQPPPQTTTRPKAAKRSQTPPRASQKQPRGTKQGEGGTVKMMRRLEVPVLSEEEAEGLGL